MKVVSPGPAATPEGRNRRLRAYVRVPAAILAASVVSFSLQYFHSLRLLRLRAWYIRAVPIPEWVHEAAGHYTFGIADPMFPALSDHLASVFSYPPVLGVVVGGFVCVITLEVFERREGRMR